MMDCGFEVSQFSVNDLFAAIKGLGQHSDDSSLF